MSFCFTDYPSVYVKSRECDNLCDPAPIISVPTTLHKRPHSIPLLAFHEYTGTLLSTFLR